MLESRHKVLLFRRSISDFYKASDPLQFIKQSINSIKQFFSKKSIKWRNVCATLQENNIAEPSCSFDGDLIYLPTALLYNSQIPFLGVLDKSIFIHAFLDFCRLLKLFRLMASNRYCICPHFSLLLAHVSRRLP